MYKPILNIIHIPALTRLNEYGLLRSKHTKGKFRKEIFEAMINNSKPYATVETNLFIYDFDTEPSYNKKL